MVEFAKVQPIHHVKTEAIGCLASPGAREAVDSNKHGNAHSRGLPIAVAGSAEVKPFEPYPEVSPELA